MLDCQSVVESRKYPHGEKLKIHHNNGDSDGIDAVQPLKSVLAFKFWSNASLLERKL
jgi:hypothetical protein